MTVTIALPEGRARLVRTLVVMSLAAGLVYPWADAWGLTPLAGVVLKGAGVALLALAAAAGARALDGRMLAAVMAAGATGDVLLNLRGGFAAGAAAFAVGHVVAIALYWRNRDPRPAAWRWLAAGALLGLGVLLCAMAAAALLSRFRLAGLGAVLFVVSDAMIGARLGNLAGGFLWGLGIWYLYYFGQLLIFTGVRAGLGASGNEIR